MKTNAQQNGAVTSANGIVFNEKAVTIDPALIEILTERQQKLLNDRTPVSAKYFERASKVLPAGVTSQFQVTSPWPTYVARGAGAYVWDVDGNEYVDFHNGFGVMAVGHANPIVSAAVKAQMDLGTHFAATTANAIDVAEELQRRWNLPFWRFGNSGTESTMDAIHLARGYTGRDIIIKIEGTYHGHHDAVMVSDKPPADQLGDRDQPNQVPAGLGMPKALTDLTYLVPFNDAIALENLLQELEGRVAAVIIEPTMLNANIILPLPGYLERLRVLTIEHDVQLIFDEVKTGATIAPGGAAERFGIKPDIVCLAKAICGGLPGAAIGMTEKLAELVEDGRVRQQGTFNGNPLVMAAAKATLLEVLTPNAYAQFEQATDFMMRECSHIIAKYSLPAYTVGLGAKGCVIFSNTPVNEYRDYLTKIDHSLTHLAWLYHMNHGVFLPPGNDENWTLSVMHDENALRKFVEAFEVFAQDVTG